MKHRTIAELKAHTDQLEQSIKMSKIGIQMECEGCFEARRPIHMKPSNIKYYTKHVAMIRDSRITLVCVECDRRVKR